MIMNFCVYDGIVSVTVAPKASDRAPRRRVAVAMCMLG